MEPLPRINTASTMANNSYPPPSEQPRSSNASNTTLPGIHTILGDLNIFAPRSNSGSTTTGTANPESPNYQFSHSPSNKRRRSINDDPNDRANHIPRAAFRSSASPRSSALSAEHPRAHYDPRVAHDPRYDARVYPTAPAPGPSSYASGLPPPGPSGPSSAYSPHHDSRAAPAPQGSYPYPPAPVTYNSHYGQGAPPPSAGAPPPQSHQAYPTPHSAHQGYASHPSTYGHHQQSYPGYDGYQATSNDLRTRRRRGNLPKETTDKLRGWFMDHLTHPYPSEGEKMELMRATGLQMNQISNWFINARRRQLPGIINSAVEREQQAAAAAAPQQQQQAQPHQHQHQQPPNVQYSQQRSSASLSEGDNGSAYGDDMYNRPSV